MPDASGVIVVPAFTGLNRSSTLTHIARASLESIVYQTAALLQAMSRDAVEAGGAPSSAFTHAGHPARPGTNGTLGTCGAPDRAVTN